jgi:FSR family fosmidomycin resistance protein-like MFS transporter
MTTETRVGTKAIEAEQFQTDQVATVSAAHAVHDTYTAFLPPLLPVFIDTLSLTRTGAGLLTVFLQGPSLFQPFIGHLADRISLRYLVILAPAVGGVTMSLLGVAPSYGILVFLLVIAGFGSAGLHSVAPVMAGRLSGNSLGRGMGFWMVGGELGRTLGPIVIVSAIGLLTLEGTPWLMVGGLLTSAVLFLRFRDLSGRPGITSQGLPWQEVLRLMGPFLVPLLGIIIVRSFMISALTTYLPLFLREEGSSLWFAGVSLSVLEAAGVIGALLAGSMSDRLGRRFVLAVALATTPFLMFGFLGVTGWLRFPLLLLLGFTALSVIPVLMALVQESFPQNRALANGVYMSLSFLIRSGVVVLLGVMGDYFGMRTAFAVSAALPLFGLPLLLLFPSKPA